MEGVCGVKLGAGSRARHVAAAQKRLPDTNVTGYAVGRAGSDPVVTGALLALLWFGATAGAYIAFGVVLWLGVLPLLVVYFFVSPPRGIAVTDDGVALLGRSLWTARPNRLLATEARSAVHPDRTVGKRVHVLVETAGVWLSVGEEGELRTAMAMSARGPKPNLSIGPPPELDEDSDDPIEGPLPGPPPPGS